MPDECWLFPLKKTYPCSSLGNISHVTPFCIKEDGNLLTELSQVPGPEPGTVQIQ